MPAWPKIAQPFVLYAFRKENGRILAELKRHVEALQNPRPNVSVLSSTGSPLMGAIILNLEQTSDIIPLGPCAEPAMLAESAHFSKKEDIAMNQHDAAEHHRKAAEHHEHAAAHHREAAEHHANGNHEKAAHHAHVAHGHGLHAAHHGEEATKHHANTHGGTIKKGAGN
jgi:hypothetical protein